MEYRDLRPAVEAFRSGRNVMATLRELYGETTNSAAVVEIAYDLQAGSYARFVDENPDYWRGYSAQLAEVLRGFAKQGDTILDVGTGEMTTLAGVVKAGLPQDCTIYGCDISYSRIRCGHDFVAQHLEPQIRRRVQGFVGDLFHLPFLDSSVDVVWTSHALEPNGGRELEAVSELLRVARRAVVLFEPSYGHNSEEGKKRMEQLGYIRDLPSAFAQAGCTQIEMLPMKIVSNPLNPTWAHIGVKNDLESGPPESPWACPATRLPMRRRADCFFSAASRLAYPIIDGVPVLRKDQAVLASILD